jgi:four helix bundle protein
VGTWLKIAVPIERLEQLDVWQGTHKLALQVYQITEGLPSSQRFGLISQMQRAAVSIPANIAEGFKRRTRPDKAHFYNMAQGSLEEFPLLFYSLPGLRL